MLRSYYSFILILFVIHHVSTQNGDEYMDYPIEPYPQMAWSVWNHNDVLRMNDRSPSLYSADKNSNDINTRGILDRITGIVSMGMCLIKCVYRGVKNCGATVACTWTCVQPSKPMPNSGGNDVELVKALARPSKKNSDVLTSEEIVDSIKCMVKCLRKHLPRDAATLYKFGSCYVLVCVCTQ